MDLEIHYLDVGQGDCTLILFKENDEIIRSVVIDCGGSRSFDAEEDVETQKTGQKLLDFCYLNGVDHFDIWIITHWDQDHFAGFNYILEEANKNGGKRIRVMLEETIIYDRGECFKYEFYAEHFISPDLKNGKMPYVNFRKRLKELNRRKKDSPNMVRKTERVYGNSDNAGLLFRLSNYTEGFRFISSEPNAKGQFVFLKQDYLLGKDLLNWHTNGTIDANLTCLAVNGFYLNSKSNSKNLYINKNTGFQTDLENLRSIGLLLTFGDFSCWFGGDLESNIEDLLIPTIKKEIGSNCLSISKASHHGSKFSTSEKFINQLQPDTLIVSSPPESGNHPHPDFLARVAQSRIIQKVYLTGCKPYIGEDIMDDGHEGTVIAGVDTNKLIGLSGDLIPDSKTRKFYVCGGIDHFYDIENLGHISVYVSGTNTLAKRIRYWESFGKLITTDESEIMDIEEAVNNSGDTFEGVKLKRDRHGNVKVVIKNKKRRREFGVISDEAEHIFITKKRKIQ